MKILFWNVDTQKDFIELNGKLRVDNSVFIKPQLKFLTDLARLYDIQVVNSADYHAHDSEELSDKPDFVNTFPPHCLGGEEGAKFIDETNPENLIKKNPEQVIGS